MKSKSVKNSTEEYRGKIIKEYEEQQESFYGKKLIILRLSGLYDASLNKMSKNFIHRKNAVLGHIRFLSSRLKGATPNFELIPLQHFIIDMCRNAAI